MFTAQRSLRQWLGRAGLPSRVDVPAQHGTGTPGATQAVRSGGHRGRAQRHPALLTVTVEQTDLLRMRAALQYSGAHSVEYVRVVPIAGSTRIRVDIALQLEAVHAAMHTIICSVKAGEFGRVTVRQPTLPSAAAPLGV